MSAASCSAVKSISTHTLRKEGDIIARLTSGSLSLFQPTPSARRVTRVGSCSLKRKLISTHTLRKEGDRFRAAFSAILVHFNPHPPQGG